MTVQYRHLVLLAALPLLLWGCGPATPPQPPVEPPEQLVSEWKKLATAGKDNLDVPAAAEIVQKLAAQGADKLNPLLDVLADKDADPYERVTAVMTLMPAISKAHEARLIELTGTQYDSTCRGCAAHLLGVLVQRRIATPDGLARMKELMADPDRHVSSAAILVMELAGDPEALAKAVELWSSPEVTPEERTSIVLNMPQRAVMKNLKIYAEAVNDTGLTEDARKRAIQDLGMVGDASVLEALKKCAETETKPVLKDMAQAAAEAVDARVKQGLMPVPVEVDKLPAPSPTDEKAAPPAPAAGAETAPAPQPQAGS